jgi:ParB family transcriptional regulator, chromosome partitioning protein
MPKQRFGLGRHLEVGRGLDALIPGGTQVSHVSDDRALDTNLSASSLFEIPVDAIVPNPQQPRAAIEDDQELLKLAESIQTYGLLQPLIVAPLDDAPDSPSYQLIAGERRWRAAQLAGVERAPVVIRGATPQLMLEIALVENLQRADLHPLEEAAAYASLVEDYHLTHEQIAERVGKERSTVTNKVRLLQLPQAVRDALLKMPTVFTEGHARAVLQINDEQAQIKAMQLIVAQNYSVRQAEELARNANAAALSLTADRRGGGARPQSYDTQLLEQEFIRAIEMKARLQRTTKGKGSLTLYFTNEEQLQTLYDRLVGAGPVFGLNGVNGASGTHGNGASGGQSYDFGSLDSIGSLLDDGLPLDGEPDGDN